MAPRVLAAAARALRRLWPLGRAGAQIMRMARTGMTPAEVAALVDGIAARRGRSVADLPDAGPVDRLEHAVRRWLEHAVRRWLGPDERRRLERAMAGRSLRGEPLAPSAEEWTDSGER